MNIHVKTSLILIVTLLIGMILGALLGGALLRSRVKDRAARIRTPHGFANRMERIIQPDESQREAVREILLRHADRFSQFHDQFAALADSLKKDLDPILTEEQKLRLERMIYAPRRMHRPERGRRGMPPGEGPPTGDPPRPRGDRKGPA